MRSQRRECPNGPNADLDRDCAPFLHCPDQPNRQAQRVGAQADWESSPRAIIWQRAARRRG